MPKTGGMVVRSFGKQMPDFRGRCSTAAVARTEVRGSGRDRSPWRSTDTGAKRR